MKKNVALKVKDITEPQRQWLESLFGQGLQEEQRIIFMVLPAEEVPDGASRQAAAGRMDQTFAKIDAHMKEQGVTDNEFDAAVDEAIQHVRHRKP